MALDFLREQAARHPQAPDPAREALVDFCLILLNLNEFLYVG